MRLIDADAVIDAIKKHACNTQRIFDAINALPSAQPEREKGAWINGGRIIRCSKCGTGYAAVKGMKSALTYNFCPNCGADMRGEQDETD